MTVAEVIRELEKFPSDCMVYTPDIRDGTAQIAKQVSELVHCHLPSGITIPNDVVITPWIGDLEDQEG